MRSVRAEGRLPWNLPTNWETRCGSCKWNVETVGDVYCDKHLLKQKGGNCSYWEPIK